MLSIARTVAPSAVLHASYAPASSAPSTQGTGALMSHLTAADAMEVLDRAQKDPTCVKAAQVLAASRVRLDALNAEQVNTDDYARRSMSNWGIFAFCGSAMGSMVLLSHSGLTGVAALAGMAAGFIVLPALALWLVRKGGEANASASQTQLDRKRETQAATVQRDEQRYQVALQTATERISAELAATRQANARPDQVQTISDEVDRVNIGGISVVKRGATEAPRG